MALMIQLRQLPFWRDSVYPANRSNLKSFKKLSLAGEKLALQKKPLCF